MKSLPVKTLINEGYLYGFVLKQVIILKGYSLNRRGNSLCNKRMFCVSFDLNDRDEYNLTTNYLILRIPILI